MVMLQLQLLLLMGAGFILSRIGMISAEGRKSLSEILVNFILPCNIICSFQIDLSMDILTSCALMLIVTCGVQGVYLLTSKYLYPGESDKRLACLRYGTVCSNAGFLGLPIVGGFYGEMGTLLTSVALIPQRVVMWSAGLSLFTPASGKSVIKKLLTHPCIVAVFIGFALMLGGNPTLPGFLQKSLSATSGCTTCISMLNIGCLLAEAKNVSLKDRGIVWYSGVRLLLIPLVVFGILTLLRVDATVRGVMTLLSGMPAGSMTAILASKYDCDGAFASCMVFVSTVASIATLPLLCLLL